MVEVSRNFAQIIGAKKVGFCVPFKKVKIQKTVLLPDYRNQDVFPLEAGTERRLWIVQSDQEGMVLVAFPYEGGSGMLEAYELDENVFEAGWQNAPDAFEFDGGYVMFFDVDGDRVLVPKWILNKKEVMKRMSVPEGVELKLQMVMTNYLTFRVGQLGWTYVDEQGPKVLELRGGNSAGFNPIPFWLKNTRNVCAMVDVTDIVVNGARLSFDGEEISIDTSDLKDVAK